MAAHGDRRHVGAAGRRANIVPMSSTVTRQPSASARALNQSRTWRSRSVSVSRQMPPLSVPPMAAVSISVVPQRSGSMARLRMGGLSASFRGAPQLANPESMKAFD
jgi:hypothetical protein